MNRELAIELLDDGSGISEKAFKILLKNLDKDIIQAVKATNNRFYLSTESAHRLRKL